MKKASLPLIVTIFFMACANNHPSNRYIKVAEASKLRPEFNKKYGVLDTQIIVMIDCEKNDLIYYDVWNEKIMNRVPIK